MIRFLLDQNVPRASADALLRAGHDVLHIESGEPDESVLALAHRESRILVTFDRDFGFLVFRTQSPRPAGVVYFRSGPTSPDSTALAILEVLEVAGMRLEGRFSVVEAGRIRQRPMPIS